MQESSGAGGLLNKAEEQLWFGSDQESPVCSSPLSVAAVYSSGRSINASMAERSILLGVMAHNLGILDSRENDTVTVLRKSQLWDEVTREFNTRTGTPRSRQQIQTLYKNMKAKARRYQARIAEIGIPHPEPDPNSEMLMALLQAQLQQQRTFLHNVTLGTEHPVINLEAPGIEQQFLIDENSGVPQGNMFGDDTSNNGTCEGDDKSANVNFNQAPILKRELDAQGSEQPFTMDGITSVLQDRMSVEESMKHSTNHDSQDVDNENKITKVSKIPQDSLANTSDDDDGYAYVNPQQLMQVCLKEEILPNTVKIEPSDIDEETQIFNKHKESSQENTETASSSHSDPLTVSGYKTLLSSDVFNGFNSVISPVQFMERNIANHSNISSRTIYDKLDLIGQNGSIVSNSLFSTKSAETVMPMIPSTSTPLSSGVKRSQPCMSYKRRRYSLYEDSGSSNQQTVHAQGNSSKVCCCPEFHRELLKLEREESNLRCQLLEEERIACTKEHEARMRLIANEDKLVQMQFKKIQSDLDDRPTVPGEVNHNVDEHKKIQSELDDKPTVPGKVDHNVDEHKKESIDHPHISENELCSSKHTSVLSSNSKQKSELDEDSISNSDTSISDTLYVS